MKKTTFLASVATGVMLISTPAMAQEASPAAQQASSNDGFGDAIIVTARRRAEDVTKVPIAITAFSGEQLVAKGIQNTGDLTKITPGLNIMGNGTKANPFIVIRAQSKAVVGNGSPGVITYMNDVPLQSLGSLIQTYDMENIQVLKGPQGTLFGRNSIGGAVLTVTKGASHDFGGYVTAELATHDFRQVEGAINLPIIKEKVALRLAAQVGHEGGDMKTYVYNNYSVASPSPGVYVATPGALIPNAHNADEFSTQSYRATLLVEPIDGIRNVTVGDYSKIRGLINNAFTTAYPNGINGALPAFPFRSQAAIIAGLGGANSPLATGYASIVSQLAQCPSGAITCNLTSAIAAAQGEEANRFEFQTSDPWAAYTVVKGISNTTTIQLGDNHQLKNIFGYRSTASFSNITLTGLPINVISTASMARMKETTDELQLSGSIFDNDLKYTIGGFYFNEKPNGVGGYQALEVNALFGLSHSMATTYLHNTSKAVYGQIDYSLDKLVPGLSLTAGLRQTWDTQSACAATTSFSPLAVGPAMVLQSGSNSLDVVPSEAECLAGTASAKLTSSQIFGDAKFKKLTYTLGANWQVTPDAMGYVVHRRGYRAGAINTPLIDPYLSAVQTYQPETLTDWEVGVKAKFRAGDMRGTLEIAAFTGDDVNNQLPLSTSQLSGASAPCLVDALGTTGHATTDCNVTTTSGGVTTVTPGSKVPINGQTTTLNAGRLTIRGIEAAATFSPFRGLTFGGSLSYVDVTVKSITLNQRMINVLTAAGRRAPTDIAIQGQPTWITNANVTIELPEKVMGGDFTATGDFHYNGAYRVGEITVPSSHQFDLRAGISNIGDTNVSVAAYVKNLTNEVVYAGAAGSSPGGFGVQSSILGKSRTFGMQLTYKFR